MTRISIVRVEVAVTDKDMREAFLTALTVNEDDHATRMVYADWLDDHDMPEEATRMRKFKEAKEWLTALAVEHLKDYHDCDTDHEAYCELLRQLKDNYDAYDNDLTIVGTSYFRDSMGREEEEKLWDCYEVVTGIAIDNRKRYAKFHCSC